MTSLSPLVLSGVSKAYPDGHRQRCVLRDVNLEISPGEIVALMGASGSGKSTLLAIAGGLELSTDGYVELLGQDLATRTRDERAALRRENVGYVFQDFNLLSALSSRDNVSIPLELGGMKGRDARRVAMEALDTVGLSRVAAQLPDSLSGGERQRVAIARAIVGKRSLVLADEPTGALDSENGKDIMALLKGLADEGTSVLIATHDQSVASSADSALLLDAGVLTKLPQLAKPAAQ